VRRPAFSSLAVEASALKTKVETIDGKETTLAAYKTEAVLIVNTASKCGFSRQGFFAVADRVIVEGRTIGASRSDWHTSYETGALSPVSSMIFPGRAREGGLLGICFGHDGFEAAFGPERREEFLAV